MNDKELNQTIIEGVEAGTVIAVLIEGELSFFHVQNANEETLKKALPVENVKRLLASKEAE